MDTWKEFEANELTHSAAHHLLAIHDVGLEYGGWARVSDIARALNITRGSVSINLRALKKRGWVETDAHRLVKLTASGLQIVRTVMAKRVVLETFFTDVLGVPRSQAAIDSCKIEHLISHSTGERLALFLRFLASGDAANAARASRFRRFHAKCPKSGTCEVCKGQCLVDEMKRAI
ncbi:MAG TPA: metal-dependent transcriptional regulator [Vicinamibacterales bacterium]|nr:metal-dependent transcriptional regulator [Vicinamibacterales bacterium]